MADEKPRVPGEGEPGTLTMLIEEVVRGAVREAAAGSWTDELRAGQVVGRYELLREAGRGGFGVVWEARDRDLGRTVAFKALRVGGEAVREKRLLAEAEVAARLSHPNVVTVLDVGRTERGVYLVQEFLTGEPLSRKLAAGRLPVPQAVRIGVEIARGLAHAHAHGVVHRDLTPGNVQVCDDGQVKLLDLGMAAALGRRKVEGGTPAYMAPEQAEGAPEDERTDVYAFGVLLYRMLAGVLPAAPGPAGRPRPASRGIEVTEAPALGELVEAMLARAPTERPRDAGVVLEALQEVAASLPRASASTGRVRVRRPPRARWVTAGVVAGLLAAAAVGVPAVLSARRAVGPGHLVLSGSSTQTGCEWKAVYGTDFDSKRERLAWRNGEYGLQESRSVERVPVWFMGSDWNQLWVPLGDVKPDVFAVQAAFRTPSGDAYAAVAMFVFTDPVGPMNSTASDAAHGGGLSLAEPARGIPEFAWYFPAGQATARLEYRGLLPFSIRGEWHVLRIEGSRSGGWLRASIDDRLVLADVGRRDLTGSHVCLQGNGGAYRGAGVMWKHLLVFEGGPGCR